MGFMQLEDTVTFLSQALVSAMCLADTASVPQQSLPYGNFARCFSQCYSYREFKNKKGGSLNASRHFNFPHLNPSSTHSIICTRTLSNLSAKTNDVDFCMIITHVACSLAFLPFLFVFYLRLSTLGDAIKGAMSFSSQKGNCR